MAENRKTTNACLWQTLTPVTIAASTEIAITSGGGAVKLNKNDANWDVSKYAVGQTVTVTGFATAGSFDAEISALNNKDMTIVNIRDPKTAKTKTIAAEAKGASVTVGTYTVTTVQGQDNSTHSSQAAEIDATTKLDGEYTTSLPGTKSSSGVLEGVREYDDAGKLDPSIVTLIDAYHHNTKMRMRLLLSDNSREYKEGYFSILQDDTGGGRDEASRFSFNMSGQGAVYYSAG